MSKFCGLGRRIQQVWSLFYAGSTARLTLYSLITCVVDPSKPPPVKCCFPLRLSKRQKWLPFNFQPWTIVRLLILVATITLMVSWGRSLRPLPLFSDGTTRLLQSFTLPLGFHCTPCESYSPRISRLYKALRSFPRLLFLDNNDIFLLLFTPPCASK